MAEMSLIKTIKFGKLDDPSTRSDRRGDIAIFELNLRPAMTNFPYIHAEAIEVVQLLFAPLGKEVIRDDRTRGKEGEQCDCWISVTDDHVVHLTHKYWSPEEVEAFKAIVRTVAPLHRWEVIG